MVDNLRRFQLWLTIKAIKMALEEDLCVDERKFVLSVQTKSMK